MWPIQSAVFGQWGWVGPATVALRACQRDALAPVKKPHDRREQLDWPYQSSIDEINSTPAVSRPVLFLVNSDQNYHRHQVVGGDAAVVAVSASALVLAVHARRPEDADDNDKHT